MKVLSVTTLFSPQRPRLTNLRLLVRPRRLKTRTTRVPTFPQQRRLLLSCPSKTPNPPKSRCPPDSRAEPKKEGGRLSTSTSPRQRRHRFSKPSKCDIEVRKQCHESSVIRSAVKRT